MAKDYKKSKHRKEGKDGGKRRHPNIGISIGSGTKKRGGCVSNGRGNDMAIAVIEHKRRTKSKLKKRPGHRNGGEAIASLEPPGEGEV